MNRCDECKHKDSCVCIPYGCECFELDLEEHDKQTRADAVEKFADYLRFVYEKSMELSVMGTNDETEKLELKGIYSQFINTIPYCVKAFKEGEQMQKGE